MGKRFSRQCGCCGKRGTLAAEHAFAGLLPGGWRYFTRSGVLPARTTLKTSPPGTLGWMCAACVEALHGKEGDEWGATYNARQKAAEAAGAFGRS